MPSAPRTDPPSDARPCDVSVVIPLYNHGHELPRSVASHLSGATLKREILIIDDASTDNSVQLAKALIAQYGSNATIRLIERQTNGGPNAAICTGLAAARGEFVTFAAADDYVEPGFAEAAIESLEQHPQAAFCFFDPSEHCVDTGRITTVPLALSERARYFSPEEFRELVWKTSFTISSNTVVYRRSAIASINGFDPALALYADWMANLVLAFRHGACYRPEVKAHFRTNAQSYSATGSRSLALQKALLFRCLDELETRYADIREMFRSAAMLPHMRARTLIWLALDARGRRFLNRRLVWRLAQREVWTAMRPFMPQQFRRVLRRTVAHLSSK